MSIQFRACSLLLVLSLAASSSTAQRRANPGLTPTPLPGPELWVSGYNSDAVHPFGVSSGNKRPLLEGVPGAQSVRVGPDGLYYVVAEKVNQVLRFRKNSFVDVFVGDDPMTPQNEAGPLNGPTAAIFGPDGNLYVASFNNNRVLRYDGTTGAFLNTFVPAASGNLSGPDAGMTFGPDGHLYVPSFNNDRVIRYDGTTGAFLNRFIGPNAGGLRNPRMLLFRPNGNLWVSSWGSNSVLAFDSTGAFLRRVVQMTRPTGFAISPYDGDLYVTSDQNNWVNRYNLLTGERVEIFLGGAAGINGATFVFFADRY